SLRDALPIYRVHQRDALHPEHLGQPRVAVDVHLGQYPGAAAFDRELLQHRRELLAGAAPLRPEVDHHRRRERALEHLGLEGGLGDVDDGHPTGRTSGSSRSPTGRPAARGHHTARRSRPGGWSTAGRPRTRTARSRWRLTERAEVYRAAGKDRLPVTWVAHSVLVSHARR